MPVKECVSRLNFVCWLLKFGVSLPIPRAADSAKWHPLMLSNVKPMWTVNGGSVGPDWNSAWPAVLMVHILPQFIISVGFITCMSSAGIRNTQRCRTFSDRVQKQARKRIEWIELFACMNEIVHGSSL